MAMKSMSEFGRTLRVTTSALGLLAISACGGGSGGSGEGTASTSARCADYAYQEDAQAALTAGQSQLDGDNDGIACESLPRRPGTPNTPIPPPSAIAQGVYTGTLSGSPASTQFRMLALENGDVWALYGVPDGSSFLVRGFLQGNVSQNATTFFSSSVQDFGLTPPPLGTMAGTITASAVNGTYSASGANVSFSGTPPASATYNYNMAASLAQVAGSWTLDGLDGTPVATMIDSNGSFVGSNAGCSVSGTITPRPSGKNVFNVSVTSGAPPCAAPGSTSTGVAVTYLLPDSITRELIVVGINAARTSGTAFFGTR